jgi:Tfp pilus assembly protein PilF
VTIPIRRRLSFLAAAALSVLAVCASGCQPKKPKTSAEVLLNERMGQVLLRENRAAEAEKAFREAVKDDPKNPEVQDGLGLSLLMQARFEESIPYFDKAVDLAPHNASYRNNRGVALMELGRYKEAAADFNTAEQSVNPDDRVSATINTGRLLLRQGDYAGAEKAFTNALAREPQSFAAVFGRASARESTGDLEGAAEDYLTAIKLNPASAEANLRLGLCLVTLKKLDLGRRYLQRAVDLDPTGDTGAKARLLLESSKKSS